MTAMHLATVATFFVALLLGTLIMYTIKKIIQAFFKKIFVGIF